MDHYPSWPAPAVRRLLRKGSCLSRHGRGLPFPDLLSGAENAGSKICSAIIRDERDKIDFFFFFIPLVPVEGKCHIGIVGKARRAQPEQKRGGPSVLADSCSDHTHKGSTFWDGEICRKMPDSGKPRMLVGSPIAAGSRCCIYFSAERGGTAGAARAGGGFGSAQTLHVLWSPCEPFPASVLSFQGFFLCHLFFKLLPQ